MTPSLRNASGILIVGHGTRHERGTAEFHAFATQLGHHWPSTAIEACFLELQEPDIATGIQRLLARGVDGLVVAPLLLFAAGHAKQDIPQIVADTLAEFTHVRSVQAEPLDCHPEVLTLADLRLRQVVDLQANDRILIVARGTSDPDGLAAIERFVSARRTQLPHQQVEVAYMAAAQPRLRERVAELAGTPGIRLILQPHLLFEGEVITAVRAVAAEFSPWFSGGVIPVADHLGSGILTESPDSTHLLRALSSRITAAATGAGLDVGRPEGLS